MKQSQAIAPLLVFGRVDEDFDEKVVQRRRNRCDGLHGFSVLPGSRQSFDHLPSLEEIGGELLFRVLVHEIKLGRSWFFRSDDVADPLEGEDQAAKVDLAARL